MTEDKQKATPEGDPADDPTRYGESPKAPPGEETSEERRENVAGRDKDVSDEESYEGGLPA
jgi:hypothetical protein